MREMPRLKDSGCPGHALDGKSIYRAVHPLEVLVDVRGGLATVAGAGSCRERGYAHFPFISFSLAPSRDPQGHPFCVSLNKERRHRCGAGWDLGSHLGL